MSRFAAVPCLPPSSGHTWRYIARPWPPIDHRPRAETPCEPHSLPRRFRGHACDKTSPRTGAGDGLPSPRPPAQRRRAPSARSCPKPGRRPKIRVVCYVKAIWSPSGCDFTPSPHRIAPPRPSLQVPFARHGYRLSFLPFHRGCWTGPSIFLALPAHLLDIAFCYAIVGFLARR